MNKYEFLEKLQTRLSNLPACEVNERIYFYAEMIDDRMEEGLSEEDAVQAVGTVEEIAYQITEEIHLMEQPTGTSLNRKWKPWEIVAFILGAPLWIPLLIVAFAVAFVCYTVLWVINLTLWAVELPFVLFSWMSDGLLFANKKLTQGSWFLTKKGCAFVKRSFKGKGKGYEIKEI